MLSVAFVLYYCVLELEDSDCYGLQCTRLEDR